MNRRDLRLDPDPLTIEPEPVRRTPVIDQDASGLVIIGLTLAALVFIAIAALVSNATPRPAPTPGPESSPMPSELAGAPQAAEVTGPQSGAFPAAPRYSGTATWYCSTVATCTAGYGPGDLIGAIDRKDSEFRSGDRVTVRAFGRAVTVLIVDTCACGGVRLIDLSRAAFARLASPDLGVIPVTLELAGEPLPTGPATDQEAP
jgi:rare lipoprotein A